MTHFNIPSQNQPSSLGTGVVRTGSRGYSPSKPKWKSSQTSGGQANNGGLIVTTQQNPGLSGTQLRTSGSNGSGYAASRGKHGSHYKY